MTKLKACSVSMDYSSSNKTLYLASKCDLVLPFVGVHPEFASNENADDVSSLIEQNYGIVSGIGEIGLDPTYSTDLQIPTDQKLVFERFLSLGEKYDKPVSIHSRKSLDVVLDTLSSFNLDKVLLHWFDGNKKQLAVAMDREYFVSFGPVTVYANDKQSLLSKTDVEKVLVETDGPVRYSRCFGFKVAQITFLPSVVFCASKVLRKNYDDLCGVLERNCQKFLGI